MADEPPDGFWTDVDADSYDSESDYRDAVLEQCKLYLGLVESNRNRRAVANSFFLGINTAAFVAIGVTWEARPSSGRAALAFPLLVLLAQCGAWAAALRSYRRRGEQHWSSVRHLEERLPARAAQWDDTRPADQRWRLTDIEQAIPTLFGLAYVGAFVAALIL
ncbi:MAG: hypothetical protein AAGA93_11330 [Actinomycetota bacterium]